MSVKSKLADTAPLLTCVHGNTTNLWSLSQPSCSTSFTQGLEVVLRIARNSDCAACVGIDLAQLTTLHSYSDALDFYTLCLFHLFLCDDNGVGSRTTTEDTAALGFGAKVEHLGAQGHHVNR